jgi:hypothetical protein
MYVCMNVYRSMHAYKDLILHSMHSTQAHIPTAPMYVSSNIAKGSDDESTLVAPPAPTLDTTYTMHGCSEAGACTAV